MKSKKIKVWCGFDGKVDGLAFYPVKTKRRNIIEVGESRNMAKTLRMPKVRYIRCPECNKRLLLRHIITDGNLYLFSEVSKHKKVIRI